MKATVKYELSESGQRAALAADLNAAVRQCCEIELESSDLAHVGIASDGTVMPILLGRDSYSLDKLDSPPDAAQLLTLVRARWQQQDAARDAEERRRGEAIAELRRRLADPGGRADYSDYALRIAGISVRDLLPAPEAAEMLARHQADDAAMEPRERLLASLSRTRDQVLADLEAEREALGAAPPDAARLPEPPTGELMG